MDAAPLLVRLLKAFDGVRLEAVLIGNAAAAIHGAPVTTLDFDFMFRATPTNLRKLKVVASALGAVILRPYYPVSNLYRMVDDATGLQADFMPAIHGVRSFEGLRARSVKHAPHGYALLVASRRLKTSSRASGPRGGIAIWLCCQCSSGRCRPSRPRARPLPSRNVPHPVIADPDMPPRKKQLTATRRQALAALARESERQLDDLIRRRLAMPLEQRMHFLRRRLPGGGSSL